MVQRIFYISLFLLMSFSVSAQELKDFNFYYAHPKVSADAKDAYARLFDINASERSYSIIDSAFTKNDETRLFYIYLIAQMLPQAEGDLRATLNIITRNLMERYPASVLAVLFVSNDRNIVQLREQWAHRMGVEIRITCESAPVNCFKKSRTTALANCNTQKKQQLEILYNMVRNDMNISFQR